MKPLNTSKDTNLYSHGRSSKHHHTSWLLRCHQVPSWRISWCTLQIHTLLWSHWWVTKDRWQIFACIIQHVQGSKRQDKKKYEQKCEKNRENARRRYSSQSENHPPDAIASKRMPSQANASISNNNSNQKSNSIDDIANANNINMESNPSLIQSNGIYDSIPRIGKQEKRQRDVLSTATKVIAGFSSASEWAR